MLRRKRKRLTPILYREEEYDGYGYSDSEEEQYYPETSRIVRERFVPEVSGGGSLLYFLGGAIFVLLLILVLQKLQPKSKSTHYEFQRDEKGKLLGITKIPLD